ncbi:MAG: hypothetical protein QOG98_1884 [Pseudonocardiales bacterium]|nr:hypothetical protein [Pseudonocardiales bacterium]
MSLAKDVPVGSAVAGLPLHEREQLQHAVVHCAGQAFPLPQSRSRGSRLDEQTFCAYQLASDEPGHTSGQHQQMRLIVAVAQGRRHEYMCSIRSCLTQCG